MTKLSCDVLLGGARTHLVLVLVLISAPLCGLLCLLRHQQLHFPFLEPKATADEALKEAMEASTQLPGDGVQHG